MIRYPITLAELAARVDSERPGWQGRARDRTDGFIAAGQYSESSGSWSEIKAVYMTLQHDKCLYCERKLASPPYGTIEHDLEHFRPKSRVRAWPPESSPFTFTFRTGAASATGYFWLAYHLFNYGTACKACNSPLKSDYFPVPAGRGNVPADPAALTAAEAPFLIYPIGDMDEDPETLMSESPQLRSRKPGPGTDGPK